MADGWEPRSDIPFVGIPGAHYEPLNADSSPVEFLELYLTDAILSRIVRQTNIYAAQCIAKVK